MLFLYNTGSRADEVAQLLIGDLHCHDSQPWVRILGKGNKVRICPLWSLTVDTIRPLIEGRDASEQVFLNRRHQPTTRFGIFAVVKRHATEAMKAAPTLQRKRVSPHTIRHTTACHLLKSGVDINTVRAWLGHVSVDTTNVYAQIDLEMKIDALSHCEIFDQAPQKRWKEKLGVIEFLKSL
jgi:integrase/recombinase XerD